MTNLNIITQLYTDNLNLVEEIHKRDSMIRVLLSKIKAKENINGRK